MPNIEISQLRVFLAAAEERNFSAAAKRLHLSQSAVSQNIQALEKAYGVELFIRRGRAVDLSNEVGGELIIGCSTSAGKYLMPTLLSQFQRQFSAVLPRVKIMGRGN